jgi:Ca2+/H+ antiporter
MCPDLIIDLLLFVVLTLLIGYVPGVKSLPIHPVAKFIFSLVSIVPLAYYIGTALSRYFLFALVFTDYTY